VAFLSGQDSGAGGNHKQTGHTHCTLCIKGTALPGYDASLRVIRHIALGVECHFRFFASYQVEEVAEHIATAEEKLARLAAMGAEQLDAALDALMAEINAQELEVEAQVPLLSKAFHSDRLLERRCTGANSKTGGVFEPSPV